MRVFIQGTSATPTHLIEAMTDYAHEAGLKDIETVHLHLEGETKFGEGDCVCSFRSERRVASLITLRCFASMSFVLQLARSTRAPSDRTVCSLARTCAKPSTRCDFALPFVFYLVVASHKLMPSQLLLLSRHDSRRVELTSCPSS